MLGEIGISILAVMGITYALTLLSSLVFIVVFLIRRQLDLFLMTFLYLFLLSVSAFFSAMPFLRMHGSYTDFERLMIIAFCLANIVLMIIFLVNRIKHLSASSKTRDEQGP